MSKFLVYRASAGSGKTYNLVLQYLSIALNADNERALQDRFRHILAITFTNKACNEMKERILRELRNCIQWIPGQKKNMLLDLQRNLYRQGMAAEYDEHQQPLAPVSLVQERARVVQTAILHDYGNFSVSTIDSFMHRVVRTFAHDLNLPLGFAPQIDTDDITQHAVDELMHSVGSHDSDQLDKILLRFANSKMEGGASYSTIDRDITQSAKELYKENVPPQLHLLSQFSLQDFIDINESLNKDNQQSEQAISQLAQQACDAIQQAVPNLDALYKKSNNAYYRFKAIAGGNYDLEEKTFSATFRKMLNGEMVISKDYPVPDALLTTLNQCFAIILQEATLRRSRLLLKQRLFEMALLNQLHLYVDAYNQDNECLPFSDITRLIYEHVCNEEAPFLFERIGTYYRHIMIDEFQDTSTMQWGSLAPLVCETLAHGNDDELGSLIVGDGKQAIYRFRQGEVQQFVDLSHLGDPSYQGPAPSLPPQCEKLGERSANYRVTQTIHLDTNYRSREQIVRFNNQFFRHLVDEQYAANESLFQPSIPSLYDQLEQQPRKEGGYVNAFFSCNDASLNRQLLLTLEMLIQQGHYTFNDISILSRRNKSLAKLISYLSTQTINGQPIPLESPDSQLLSESTAVNLVLSLLHYLLTPDDRSVAFQILQYLYQLGMIDEIPIERLYDKNTPIPLEDILSQYHYLFSPHELRSLPLLDCCEKLIRSFSGADATLKLQDIQMAHLATFLDAVARYSKSHHQDLSDFVSWADEHVGKISVKGAPSNAIQLMSIHKAKGLEKRVVIYYDPDKKEPMGDNIWVPIEGAEQRALSHGLPVGFVTSSDSKGDSIFLSAQQSEKMARKMDELNSLYVAFTRPIDNFFIISQRTLSLQRALLLFLEQKAATCESDSNNQQGRYTDPIVVQPIAVEASTEDDECEAFAIGSLVVYHEEKGKETVKENDLPIRTVALNQLSYADWHQSIVIADHSREALSQLQYDKAAQPLSPTEMGNLVHRILSLFESSHDWHQFQQNPMLDGHPVDEKALQQVAAVIESPTCSRFFDPQYRSIREHPMIVQEKGGKMQERRADRIVLTPSATWVVDFKTGEIHSDSNLRQVQQYMCALEQMGYPNVQGFLLYIRPDQEPEIVQV